MTQRVRNHECVHARQWFEVTALSGSILLAIVLVFGISPWWLLLSPVVYYIWYIVEWLVRLPSGNAYRNISFEREAYDNDDDLTYLDSRKPFEWLKYLFG